MSGLPPLLVHAGGAEALCADATRIIERAKEHGVEVVSTIYPEMIHAFHLFGDILPEGEKATAEVADFLLLGIELGVAVITVPCAAAVVVAIGIGRGQGRI